MLLFGGSGPQNPNPDPGSGSKHTLMLDPQPWKIIKCLNLTSKPDPDPHWCGSLDSHVMKPIRIRNFALSPSPISVSGAQNASVAAHTQWAERTAWEPAAPAVGQRWGAALAQPRPGRLPAGRRQICPPAAGARYHSWSPRWLVV